MQHDETESMVATCGSEKLIEAIAPEVDLVNAAAIQPVNATIAYDEARLAYAVVPEVEGTALDLNKVADQVKEDVKTLSPKITVTKDATLSPTVFKDDERLAAAVDEANVMIKADLPQGATPSAPSALTRASMARKSLSQVAFMAGKSTATPFARRLPTPSWPVRSARSMFPCCRAGSGSPSSGAEIGATAIAISILASSMPTFTMMRVRSFGKPIS